MYYVCMHACQARNQDFLFTEAGNRGVHVNMQKFSIPKTIPTFFTEANSIFTEACLTSLKIYRQQRQDNRVHVGRQEQGQLSSARPRKRSYMKSAAQQGASEEHEACIERHGQI